MNGGLSHAKSDREFGLGNSRTISFPYAKHFILCQFVVLVFLACRFIGIFSATLGNAISLIIKSGSDEQVRGTHARRIVATMAEESFAWISMASQFPRKSMRSDLSAIDWKKTVTTLVLERRPVPAICGLLDVFPKSLFDLCIG